MREYEAKYLVVPNGGNYFSRQHPCKTFFAFNDFEAVNEALFQREDIHHNPGDRVYLEDLREIRKIPLPEEQSPNILDTKTFSELLFKRVS